MTAKPHERIQIVAKRDWTARIDDWRRKQEKIPSRSDAIRKLAEMALDQIDRTRPVVQR